MPIFGSMLCGLLWVRVRGGAPSGQVDRRQRPYGVCMAGQPSGLIRQLKPCLSASFLPAITPSTYIHTSPNGCYRPHGAHGASFATQRRSTGTLLTVSLCVRMICGEPSLQAEATVPFHAGHGRYQMSYEDPTRPVADAQGSYRTLSSSGRSPDSHANKKFAGSISRTSHLQLFRHRATYMASRECAVCLGLST